MPTGKEDEPKYAMATAFAVYLQARPLPTIFATHGLPAMTTSFTRVPTTRIHACILAAAMTLPAIAAAQGNAALEPLAVPDGAPMRCAVAAASGGAKPLPPKHAKLEYYFGDTNDPERGVTVLFDSAGRAVQLNELTFQTRNGGELLIHGITVAFDSTGSAEGFHSVRRRSAPPPHPDLALPILTIEERARARALADWLERHRCDRDVPKPVAPKPE